jgi:hypothetical protein
MEVEWEADGEGGEEARLARNRAELSQSTKGQECHFFMCLFEETSNNPFACLLHGNGSLSVA